MSENDKIKQFLEANDFTIKSAAYNVYNPSLKETATGKPSEEVIENEYILVRHLFGSAELYFGGEAIVNEDYPIICDCVKNLKGTLHSVTLKV